MRQRQIVSMDPRDLKNHPLALEVFGESQAEGLDQSIVDWGVLQPIVANSYKTVVSGHCRRRAAIKAGVTAVPVLIDDLYDDPRTAAMAVIMSNIQRALTIEQKARMYKELLHLKQTEAIKEKIAEKVDVHRSPPTRLTSDLASLMSDSTSKRAAAVVDEIDALEKSGETVAADELRSELEESVTRAHDHVRGRTRAMADSRGCIVPEQLEPVFKERGEFRRQVRCLQSLVRWVEQEIPIDGAYSVLQHQELAVHFKNAIEHLQATMPYAVCPYCEGTGCKKKKKGETQCNGRGWLVEFEARGIPEERWAK